MADTTEYLEKKHTFNFYTFFFPPKDLKTEENEQEIEAIEQVKKSKGPYILYLILFFYAIYISYKCNNGFYAPDLLMACTFPTCYIFYKIGTDFNKCFPELIENSSNTIKILE